MEKRRKADFSDGYQSVPGELYNDEYEEDIVDYDEDEDMVLKFDGPDTNNDWPFSTVFVLQALVVTIFSILTCVRWYEVEHSTAGTFTYEQKMEVMQMSAVACMIAMIVSFGWLLGIHVFTPHVVRLSLLNLVATGVLCAIAALVVGGTWTGITLLVLSGLVTWYSVSIHPGVFFSSAILKLVVGITRLYPATVALAIAGAFVQFIWLLLWSYLTINLLAKDSEMTFLELTGLMLSLYWTSQVIKNIVHVSVAGTVATWYFMHETGMPLNPTLRSCRRASTSSLGSVCLGSILVEILQTARAVASFARRSNISTLNFAASCMMRVLDQGMAYFNLYAFTQVAMYGKPFLKAGQDTWSLLNARGVDALITQDLVAVALFSICTATGAFTGMCGGLWADQHENLDVHVVTGICFGIGFSIAQAMVAVIEGGASAVFVCYAEDPEILSRADPVTFSQMRERCCVDSSNDFA